MVQWLCKEGEVEIVDLWDRFVEKEEMYLRDGLHFSGKGAADFAEGLSGAVVSGLGKINKKNELNIMVDDINPDIIGITESWANNDITYAELGLAG